MRCCNLPYNTNFTIDYNLHQCNFTMRRPITTICKKCFLFMLGGGVYMLHVRFISGRTPANLLEASITAKSFFSTCLTLVGLNMTSIMPPLPHNVRPDKCSTDWIKPVWLRVLTIFNFVIWGSLLGYGLCEHYRMY